MSLPAQTRDFPWLYKEFSAFVEDVEKLSLEERTSVLVDLYRAKKDFERRLKSIAAKVNILEMMPDIAFKKISESRDAVSLLRRLREVDHGTYSEIQNSPEYSVSFSYYLDLFRNAGLIRTGSDPFFFEDPILMFTEQGYEFLNMQEKQVLGGR